MIKQDFSIQDIIKDSGKTVENPMVDTAAAPNNEQEPTSDDTPVANAPVATPVRYNGGETEKDSNGNVYTEKKIGGVKNFIKGDKADVPIQAKKGEPQYGSEWAEDAAQMAWDTGKSMDEIEAEMNKKWPLAAAQIKDSESKTFKPSYTEPGSSTSGEYLPYYERMINEEGGYNYRSPREQAEELIAESYGLIYTEYYNRHSHPSKAVSLMNKVPALKKSWKELIDRKSNAAVSKIKNQLQELREIKTSKELKKLGFSSKRELDVIVNYIEESLEIMLIQFLSKTKIKAEEVPNKEEFKEVEESINNIKNAKVVPVAEKAKEVEESINNIKNAKVVPVAEKAKEEYAALKEENAALKAKADKEVPNKEPFKEEENIKEVVPEEPPVDNITENKEPIENGNEEQEPVEDDSFAREMARLDAEKAEQEKQALEEAEKIADRQKIRKEAEKADAAIEEAARKAQEHQFEYEDWLKNPTLISGIFGKSGLSVIKRVGLGLATLFSIFSDVAANYGRGINNSTDFRNTAMDMLNSTIKKIQDTRAESIGKMAAKPYETTAENEEAINKDYLKLRKDGIGTHIPENTLKMFIQESQINTDEPLSEDLYERLTDAAREGYIESRRKDRKLRMQYLDEDGNLNPEGEVEFLKNQERFIKNYRNVLGISKERMSNIDARLTMDIRRAEVRAKVHDVTFKTSMDYINAINALKEENKVLEASKLEFTSALTLDSMLELAEKNRSVIAGLSTSNTNRNLSESDSESSLTRFNESGGVDRVNETLKKHGWQAELNGEAGVRSVLKVVPISTEITGGGKWSREEAEKFSQSEYEKWSKDEQTANSKNSSLSTAAGKNIDDAWNDIRNFLDTEKAKGVEADLEAVRKQVLEEIDSKIDFNNQVIQELNDMRDRESRFDTGTNDSVSTKNPYVSMYNDVPTKNSDWYKHRLGLS